MRIGDAHPQQNGIARAVVGGVKFWMIAYKMAERGSGIDLNQLKSGRICRCFQMPA